MDWSRHLNNLMSYLIFCSQLSICSLSRINYICLGRESSLLVIMLFRFGGVSPSSWCFGRLHYFNLALPEPSIY